jgi:IS5 family transposase
LICREVQVNLAYRWFCKLGIEDAIPDHSAFSRARHDRFRQGNVFRQVFERVVEACIATDLVGGEGFAVDASLIQADANKQRSIAGGDWRKDRDPARSSQSRPAGGRACKRATCRSENGTFLWQWHSRCGGATRFIGI